MNKRIISLLALLWCFSLYAQNSYDELFHLSYDYFSPSTFSNTNTELARQQMKLSGAYGFTLNSNEDLLNFGLSYQWLELKPSLPIHQTLSIHNTGIGMDYLKHWKSPNWASTISAGIGVLSDYKTFSSSSFQTSIAAMLHYGKSEDLIWTFGLLYSDQPFGAWFFPILGVDWKINNRLYVSSILLDYTYLEYAIKPNLWYTGIDIRAMGLSFAISEYENQPDTYLTSFSDSFPYYPYAITLFNDFYLREYLTLFCKAGVLVSQENRHFTQAHTPLNSVYNNSIDPSFYLNIGIAMRFRNF